MDDLYGTQGTEGGNSNSFPDDVSLDQRRQREITTVVR